MQEPSEGRAIPGDDREGQSWVAALTALVECQGRAVYWGGTGYGSHLAPETWLTLLLAPTLLKKMVITIVLPLLLLQELRNQD